MLSLETINKDTIWVVKMQGWRDSGTYDEMKRLAESDECRDFDVACEQPEHLKPFWDAYWEYEKEHGFTYIDQFYEVWSVQKT